MEAKVYGYCTNDRTIIMHVFLLSTLIVLSPWTPPNNTTSNK